MQITLADSRNYTTSPSEKYDIGSRCLGDWFSGGALYRRTVSVPFVSRGIDEWVLQ